MTAHTPLHGPDDAIPFATTLDGELDLARAYLDQVAAANIHDDMAMLKAATGLNYRLRALIRALDTERGERP